MGMSLSFYLFVCVYVWTCECICVNALMPTSVVCGCFYVSIKGLCVVSVCKSISMCICVMCEYCCVTVYQSFRVVSVSMHTWLFLCMSFCISSKDFHNPECFKN